MTRLIVEEGGARRGFKVGDGVLTIGSGEGAALRLTSDDVAEIHAELGVEDGRATLRTRPGVLAPVVGGVPVSGSVELKHGVPVKIGSAKLTVEYAEAPASRRPAAVARKRSGARPGAARPRRSEQGDGKRERRSRTRARQKRGPWVSLAIFAGAVAALALFVFFVGPLLLGEAEPIFQPAVRVNRAREKVAKGLHEAALAELDAIPASIELDPAFRQQIDDMRTDIAANIERIALADHNLRGNETLQTQLKNFESRRLAGKAERPQIRVFLKRCDEFEAEYPRHPEIDWVRRMRERYAAAVDLTEPPTYADIEFEIEALTWADPRDFKQAFQILDRFIESAVDDDRAAALTLYDEKLRHRDEWFEDKMQQARWEYERDSLGVSMAWLVRIIVYTGDEVMAERAAQELIRFPKLVERLRGYRRHSPDSYEILTAQPTMAAFVRDNPLDE